MAKVVVDFSGYFQVCVLGAVFVENIQDVRVIDSDWTM